MLPKFTAFYSYCCSYYLLLYYCSIVTESWWHMPLSPISATLFAIHSMLLLLYCSALLYLLLAATTTSLLLVLLLATPPTTILLLLSTTITCCLLADWAVSLNDFFAYDFCLHWCWLLHFSSTPTTYSTPTLVLAATLLLYSYHLLAATCRIITLLLLFGSPSGLIWNGQRT
jgi:hypothetical protein